MKEKINITSIAEEMEEGDLTQKQRKLLQETRQLYNQAYAPYSNFKVAAIAVLENGIMIKGTNQENAAYPSGICAERVALFQAGALYPDVAIETLCITATSAHKAIKHPVSPCGACLQVMGESEYRQKKPFLVMLAGEEGKVLLVKGVHNFLPFRFSPDEL